MSGANQKIRINIGDKVLSATVLDNPTAEDFLSLLPLKVRLSDYARTEKISRLPRKLSTNNAPGGVNAHIGDIAYYMPWGNLAIFYKDYGYAQGLIHLGHIEDDLEALNVSDGTEVSIEAYQ